MCKEKNLLVFSFDMIPNSVLRDLISRAPNPAVYRTGHSWGTEKLKEDLKSEIDGNGINIDEDEIDESIGFKFVAT